MNYIFDINKLNELLKIQGKVYDNYISILNVPKKSNEYYKIIADTMRLSKKESELIMNLPELVSSLNRICTSVKFYYLSNSNDLSKAIFVLNRFDNVIDERCSSIIDSDELSDDVYFSDVLLINSIKNQIMISFASKSFNNNFYKDVDDFVKKVGMLGAYSNKAVSDKLVFENFDISSLETLNSFEMIEKFDTSFEVYNDIYFDIIYEQALDILMDIYTNCDIYYDNELYINIAFNISLLRFLLVNLSDEKFNKIRTLFNEDLKNSNIENNSISILSDVLNASLNERYSSELAELNSNILGNEYLRYATKLIKLEKTILDNYLNNEVNGNIIDNLFEIESEILSSICIDDFDLVYDLIDNDIDYIIDADIKTKYLIKMRLLNLMGLCDNICDEISSLNYDMILSNHLNRTLNIIYENEHEKFDDIYKEVFFIYPNLSNDLMIDFSDEVSSKILGFESSLNYNYDNNEQLYYLGINLINEIKELENNPSFISIYEFKIYEFNDIIGNVSDEYLYSLRDIIISSSIKVKDKFEILNNLEKRYKI